MDLIRDARADHETDRSGRRGGENVRRPGAKTGDARDYHDDREDRVGDRHTSASTDEFAF
jgi:hypothetical protein